MISGFGERKYVREALKKRLHEEGVFSDWCRVRDHLKSPPIKCPPTFAWQVASYFFPPKNGLAPEIALDGAMGVWIEKYKNFPIEEFPPPKPFLPGSPILDMRPESQLPHPIKEEMGKDMRRSIKDWEDDWAELASKVDDTRSADIAECAMWVLDNHFKQPKEVDPDTVPAVRALTMAKWARQGSNLTELMKTIVPKLMPDRKQLENASRFQDDGREQLELLERFEEDFEQQMGEELEQVA